MAAPHYVDHGRAVLFLNWVSAVARIPADGSDDVRSSAGDNDAGDDLSRRSLAAGLHWNIPSTFEERHPLGFEPIQRYFAIRELRSSDALACQEFFRRLEWSDVRIRFASRHFCFDLFFPKPSEGETSVAFVALDAAQAILGVVNLVSLSSNSAEVATIVRSDCKRCGIGRALILHATERARRDGLSELIAYVQPENRVALRFAHAMGFRSIGEDHFCIEV